MKIVMVHNNQVRELPDHLAQRLIDADKAIEIVDIWPSAEELSALGIKPDSEQPTAVGYEVRLGETMDESNKRHGIESDQPSAD